jgi:hypothetical protein
MGRSIGARRGGCGGCPGGEGGPLLGEDEVANRREVGSRGGRAIAAATAATTASRARPLLRATHRHRAIPGPNPTTTIPTTATTAGGGTPPVCLMQQLGGLRQGDLGGRRACRASECRVLVERRAGGGVACAGGGTAAAARWWCGAAGSGGGGCPPASVGPPAPAPMPPPSACAWKDGASVAILTSARAQALRSGGCCWWGTCSSHTCPRKPTNVPPWRPGRGGGRRGWGRRGLRRVRARPQPLCPPPSRLQHVPSIAPTSISAPPSCLAHSSESAAVSASAYLRVLLPCHRVSTIRHTSGRKGRRRGGGRASKTAPSSAQPSTSAAFDETSFWKIPSTDPTLPRTFSSPVRT